VAIRDDDIVVRESNGLASLGGHVLVYRGHQSVIGSLAWSPDGTHIASVSNDLQVWQAG